jgi:DNA polymerase III epsilon subunit-like protein
MGFLRKLFGKLNITDHKYYEMATNECQKTEAPQEKDSPMVRKHAKPEIDKFLDLKQKTRIIIFDVETNGLNGSCSVLSCSAIKFDFNHNTLEMTEIDRFNRFYYPVERFDPQAITINGLTRDVIKRKRGQCTYPEHFLSDSDFEIFCTVISDNIY